MRILSDGWVVGAWRSVEEEGALGWGEHLKQIAFVLETLRTVKVNKGKMLKSFL